MTILAGCGGSNHTATTPKATPSDPNADLKIPGHVPRRAQGRPDQASVKVIARWLEVLRRGDEVKAATFWATGAKFQNATPVLTIDTPIEKLAIQQSLPCGARIKEAGGPKPFVVLVFVLTQRPGGDCGSGVGQTARGAIRVAQGKIVEWYRLPDDPNQQQPDVAVTEGGSPA
jgi:hypothetical protein